MAEAIAPSYVFHRGQRSVMAEVLFPKKARYQGTIYDALEEGLREEKVKEYLSNRETIASLIEEMKDYPQLFDPVQYDRTVSWPEPRATVERARERIDMYKSHFGGWSMYEIDGVFWDEDNNRLYEERTQIIRLIFRLGETFQKEAKDAGCYDVLEALTRWVMAEHMRLDHMLPWSPEEKARFILLHSSWPEHKMRFLDEFYEPITKAVKKWVDDIGLFIFGYLVRKFWVNVIARAQEETNKEKEENGQAKLKEEKLEQEIWVVSFFNVNLNIVRKA